MTVEQRPDPLEPYHSRGLIPQDYVKVGLLGLAPDLGFPALSLPSRTSPMRGRFRAEQNHPMANGGLKMSPKSPQDGGTHAYTSLATDTIVVLPGVSRVHSSAQGWPSSSVSAQLFASEATGI